MIDCTDLFPDAEWAMAHIEGTDMVRINLQSEGRNQILCIHIRISKLANFLECCRSEQHEVKPDRKCLVGDLSPASVPTTDMSTLENGLG